MLVHVIELHQAISEWTFQRFNGGAHTHLGISDTEWMHVRYLVALFYPYFLWTESLSATSVVTIHKAWSVYTGLFLYLEDMLKLLLCRREAGMEGETRRLCSCSAQEALRVLQQHRWC